MKYFLPAILITLVSALPALAGYSPPKNGGPGTSDGTGTRMTSELMRR